MTQPVFSVRIQVRSAAKKVFSAKPPETKSRHFVAIKENLPSVFPAPAKTFVRARGMIFGGALETVSGKPTSETAMQAASACIASFNRRKITQQGPSKPRALAFLQ